MRREDTFALNFSLKEVRRIEHRFLETVAASWLKDCL